MKMSIKIPEAEKYSRNEKSKKAYTQENKQVFYVFFQKSSLLKIFLRIFGKNFLKYTKHFGKSML